MTKLDFRNDENVVRTAHKDNNVSVIEIDGQFEIIIEPSDSSFENKSFLIGIGSTTDMAWRVARRHCTVKAFEIGYKFGKAGRSRRELTTAINTMLETGQTEFDLDNTQQKNMDSCLLLGIASMFFLFVAIYQGILANTINVNMLGAVRAMAADIWMLLELFAAAIFFCAAHDLYIENKSKTKS